MKAKNRWVVLTAAVLLAGLAAVIIFINRTPFSEKDPAVGAMAPDIALSDMAGSMVRLSDFKGRMVLINFWAGWCPPCRAEMPGFQKVYDEFSDKGLAIICIALDDISPSLISEMKLTFPVARAGSRVLKDYGDISDVPASFLLDREGRIIKKLKGYYDEAQLREDVKKGLK
ncbi:MAG: TlpA family protein disulfide reductase [Nitrospirae bacterium]|nr:TlpA family protein disulfide reductase [Nitrospirota bacterium]